MTDRHARDATGGRSFAELGRFFAADGGETGVEEEALRAPDGSPVRNPLRTVAFEASSNRAGLYTSIMAFRVSDWSSGSVTSWWRTRSTPVGWAWGERCASTRVRCPWSNVAFTPSADELARARAIMARAGDGSAAAVDGQMIDAALVRRARQLLRLAHNT